MPQKQTPVHPPRTHIVPTIFLALKCRIFTFHTNNPTLAPSRALLLVLLDVTQILKDYKKEAADEVNHKPGPLGDGAVVVGLV